MRTGQAEVPHDVSVKAAGLEQQLAAALSETSEELAHAECFDTEQRSELYTILQTLISDTQTHRQWIGQWVRDDPRGAQGA
ncbi:MAG TPA: hypothetical protein VM389_10340 [Phycisphaerae bacterium]|nr:hypothetical protein [Phycisphaerae bacterium]